MSRLIFWIDQSYQNRILKNRPLWTTFALMLHMVCSASLLAIFSGTALAQSKGCDEGVIRLPDRNGTIVICSTLAAQVPALAKQLTEATQTLGGQKVQLKELTRLVKGINGVSTGIGEERQSLLLQKLSSELVRSQQAGSSEVKRSIEVLSDKIDNLREQLLSGFSNPSTAAATGEAIRGAVGDAISRLDFGAASTQLEDIVSRLKALQSDVVSVKTDTLVIRQQLDGINQRQLFSEKNAQEGMDAFAINQKNQLYSPERFGSFTLGLLTPSADEPGKWSLNNATAELSGDRKWAEATVVIIMRQANGEVWGVDATSLVNAGLISGKSTLPITFDQRPSSGVACLSALDTLRGRRMALVQDFGVRQYVYGSGMFELFPISPAKLIDENDKQNPCKARGKLQKLENILKPFQIIKVPYISGNVRSTNAAFIRLSIVIGATEWQVGDLQARLIIGKKLFNTFDITKNLSVTIPNERSFTGNFPKFEGPMMLCFSGPRLSASYSRMSVIMRYDVVVNTDSQLLFHPVGAAQIMEESKAPKDCKFDL